MIKYKTKTLRVIIDIPKWFWVLMALIAILKFYWR